MFAEAVRIASGFTFPYIGLRKRADGSVFTIVAAFVVVNPDGWIVTSAHVIEEVLASQRSTEGTRGDSDHPGRVVQRSEVWAVPGFEESRPGLAGGRVNRAADIAVGRLTAFDPGSVSEFPVLRDSASSPLRQGESVCRYGFPFHTVNAGYDESTGEFSVGRGAFPVPAFALDGIVARFNHRAASDGSSALFVETSTPGLRGQSGGPLMDVAGRLCGIQSQTAHLDLGFDAPYAGADGSPVTERQFLNVGLASHVDEVRALLDAEGAPYRSA